MSPTPTAAPTPDDVLESAAYRSHDFAGANRSLRFIVRAIVRLRSLRRPRAHRIFARSGRRTGSRRRDDGTLNCLASLLDAPSNAAGRDDIGRSAERGVAEESRRPKWDCSGRWPSTPKSASQARTGLVAAYRAASRCWRVPSRHGSGKVKTFLSLPMVRPPPTGEPDE